MGNASCKNLSEKYYSCCLDKEGLFSLPVRSSSLVRIRGQKILRMMRDRGCISSISLMARMLKINTGNFALAGIGVVVIAVMAFGSDKGPNSSNKAKDMEALSDFATPEPVAVKQFPVAFDGRLSIGDLDRNGSPEIVVSNRNKLAAYNLSGTKLWQVPATTNWDYPRHYFWNWTSYGYIENGNFLHIGADWKSLYVRDGKSGTVNKVIPLPAGQWMYTLADENTAYAFTPSYYEDAAIAAVDTKSGQVSWVYNISRERAGLFAYMPPILFDDKIAFGTITLNENGQELRIYNDTIYGLGGIHTLTVRDIDPDKSGLESIVSVYGPRPGQPSLVAYSQSSTAKLWANFSPHKEKHPHQHTVGDFLPGSPGLEIVARNNSGFNHWLVSAKGETIRPNIRVDPGWSGDGEYVYAIYWDESPATELLYLEGHVNKAWKPRLRVTSVESNSVLTPIFGGGAGSTGWRGNSKEDNSPYEGGAHVVDLFGDGREEILTIGGGKISIFYKPSGPKVVKKKWSDSNYRKRKKIWAQAYNPR